MDPLERLDHAIAKHRAADTAAVTAREQLYDVIRDISRHPAVRQVDIVKRTGWTREHIRNIVKRGADQA